MHYHVERDIVITFLCVLSVCDIVVLYLNKFSWQYLQRSGRGTTLVFLSPTTITKLQD